MKLLPRRLLPILALALLPMALVGCTQRGHLDLFGYTTEPVYDPDIRTVYVKTFDNVTYRLGLEFDLTKAVIREIEAKTPFKVTNCRETADTELIGKIVSWRKSVINQNQLNEVREAEIGIAVELVWRDLRPGGAVPLAGPGGDVVPTPPVLVQPSATFIPELGGSRTSAEKMLIDNLAVGIVQKMELARPW
jgi:hypothetical protein